MALDPLSGITAALPASAAGAQAAAGSRFTQALQRLLESTERSNAEANSRVSAMLDGQGDVHDAMIALQRAEMTLQLTVQVRNKLLQAYQEVMRMPV
ncbi:MAG TPA: flagellar hook-basal body complex protein FliE [Vicinamibacterales bacterium]